MILAEGYYDGAEVLWLEPSRTPAFLCESASAFALATVHALALAFALAVVHALAFTLPAVFIFAFTLALAFAFALALVFAFTWTSFAQCSCLPTVVWWLFLSPRFVRWLFLAPRFETTYIKCSSVAEAKPCKKNIYVFFFARFRVP